MPSLNNTLKPKHKPYAKHSEPASKTQNFSQKHQGSSQKCRAPAKKPPEVTSMVY